MNLLFNIYRVSTCISLYVFLVNWCLWHLEISDCLYPYISTHKVHFYFNTAYLSHLFYITIFKKFSYIRKLSQF